MANSNVNVKVDSGDKIEAQTIPPSPDMDASHLDERPETPGTDARHVDKGPECLPEIFCRLLSGESLERTPSEKLVRCAKERDMLYDRIRLWSKKLESATARETADGDNVEFMREYLAALTAAKDVLTRRITTLLDQS